MAYAITDKPNTEAPSADYPFGRTRDKSPSLAGTPVTTLTHGDFHQFFAKLMDFAGITPNGLPDNEYSGWQLMEALMALMGGMKTKIVNIGAWNMDSTAIVNVPHGLAGASKIRELSALIISDDGSNASPLVLIDVTGGFGGALVAGATDISLSRPTGSTYDSASYNDAAINRGYIVIKYIEEL